MLLKMFLIFFKIGAFTFGGGYAMIPIIKEEIVDKQGWIEEEEFIDALAVVQGSPGPVAVNTSIYIGYRLQGFKGALVSVLGTVLPSFLIILMIATVFSQFRGNPIVEKVFKGIRPTVVALIVSAVYKLVQSAGRNAKTIVLGLLTVVLIVFFDISPIYIILAGGIGHILLKKFQEKNG